MTLQRPNADEVTLTRNRSRDVTPASGICSRCVDGCTGNCELWKASFRGREVLYPEPFGQMTAGADKDYPVDYSHLNICGYALGARGLPEGVEPGPDSTLFVDVETETAYGVEHPVTMRLPVFTGALGSTDIARHNWEHFAAGAGIAGITLVCGENVCGVDPEAEFGPQGRIVHSPEMKRRVETYRRWHQGYGDLVVQLNVEDTRFGVAEYVVQELGVETIELKWGQGAKCIGGEIQVDSLEKARELLQRGYLVTPDPNDPGEEAAYLDGALKEFERHSRLGFVEEETFLAEVERLRELGARRVTLKTGAYPMRELAMALRWSSDAKIDLVTIDGAPGGTGMSPWRMMNEWGVPTFYLQCMTYELCRMLSKQGDYVPHIAMAGGFSAEDHIFKVLALGAPYTKAVCMGRGLMIPGMVGKNTARWLADGKLPKTVSKFGDRPEQIFVCYDELVAEYGAEAVRRMPLGAVAIYSVVQKLRVGLQQLMAGSRNFTVSAISRNDLMALTEEAARISGIPYVMDAYRDEAMRIISGDGSSAILAGSARGGDAAQDAD